MPLDLSQINPELDAQPAFVADVAYLRRNAAKFINYVNEIENLSCTHVEPLKHGTWNSVYLLQPHRLVLKLSPWSNTYEVKFLSYAQKANLATPKLVAHGALPDSELKTAGYILMEYIPNTANPDTLLKNNKLTKKALLSIGENVASILATLHEQKFGYIRSSDIIHSDWASAINLRSLEERAPFNKEWLKRFEAVFEETKYRNFNQGHLIHSDANLNNILIDKDDHSFKVLIDPGPTTVGMPMFDLAYATWPWQYGIEYMQTIISTYQSQSSLFDEKLFYTSLVFIAYQQAEFGNFRSEHMPFFEEQIYPKVAL